MMSKGVNSGQKQASVHRAIAGCKYKHATFSERSSSPDTNPQYPGRMDLGRDTTHKSLKTQEA